MKKDYGKVLDKIKDKRVVMLQSGGLDSNVIASMFNFYGFEVHHLFVDYGQNSSKKEREMAKKIALHYGSNNYFHAVTLNFPWLEDSTTLVKGDPSLTDEEMNTDPLNAVKGGEYVPMRNHVLISIASSLAESLEIKYIASALDGAESFFSHTPKCGTTDKHPYFVKKIEKSITEGSSLFWIHHKRFKILVPVMDNFKEDTIRLGIKYGADFSLSWSCYNSTEKPCGVCGACRERERAFNQLGLKDPLKFE